MISKMDFLVYVTITSINIFLVNLTEAKDNGKGKRADETMKNELHTTEGKYFFR